MTLETLQMQSGDDPVATIIVLHGLGADGNDFVPIAESLSLDEIGAVRCVFPHAPVCPVTINGGMAMRAWYDILGTDLVKRHRRNLAREAPHYIRLMLKDHPRLINRVHAANTVAVAWLRRVGFTLHPATPEPNGEMFHTFEMSADGNR